MAEAFVIECLPMTTHRSLNKLEFKAHMSIHNMTEVSESSGIELEAQNWTRDRFQKVHFVSDELGNSRLWRPKATALALLLMLMASSAFATPNTDVTVESETFEKRVLGYELEPEDEPITFYRDGDTSLILNDDVQPQMNMEF
jgi:hypothetical protein